MICLLFVFMALASGVAIAGPGLDEALNYMFMDQSVPMKGPQELFDAQRSMTLTKEQPIGQTFVTGPETDRIVRVRAYLSSYPGWQVGEGAELVLWDSPDKKVILGRYSIWYEFRGFNFRQAEWEINTRVKPNTSYYFEISYVGKGDGQLSRVGLMGGSDAYKSGQGYLAGKEADFDVCFQIHSKKAPDKVGNMKRMFARFNLNRPELAEIKASVDKEDFDAAIAKTVAHFESRKTPEPFIGDIGIPKFDPAYDTKEADLIMQNWFYSSEGVPGYIGPDMNWRAEFSYDANGAPVASHNGLNNFGPKGTLTKAYLGTGNEKYMRKFSEIVMDQYNDNSPPPFSHIGGNAWDPAWNSLATGLRLGQLTIAYARAAGSPNFTTEARMAFILHLADCADTLVMTGGDASGNWSLTQNTSLLGFGLNNPEFVNSPEWQKTATDRLALSIDQDFLPDGTEIESAISYQRMAYNPLARSIYDDFIKGKGLKTPFSDRLGGLLEKQAEEFMYIAMPNGITPHMGDWAHDQIRPAILEDAKRFNRPDMSYVGTAGREGEKPKELSKLYPYAGTVMLRSDWGDAGRPFEDARYMLFHGVHFGPHGHQDLNGVWVYAYGRELLSDPGSHIYASPEHNLLLSAVSHNVMTVDGGEITHNVKAAFKNWSTTPVADYLSSWIDAYSNQDNTRDVFYIRSNGDAAKDYWVVRDTAGGSGNHSLEQRWHFPMDSNPKTDRKSLTTTTSFASGGNLSILQINPSRLTADETPTDTFSINGTDKPPSKMPTVVYKSNASLPAAIDTVLFPFEGNQQDAKQETIEKSANGLDSAFKIVQGKVEDTFILQSAPALRMLPSEKISFYGEKLFVRRADGKLRSVLLINGHNLTIDGKPVIKSDNPTLWTAISFEKSGPKVYCNVDEPSLTVMGKKATVTVINVKDLLRPTAQETGPHILIRK